MKTYMAKGETVEHRWYVVDATDMVLGRLSSQVAAILRGKNKPIYTPHVDTGDHVIIINADKVRLTGKKLEDKTYKYHTGYPGGLKEITYGDLLAKKPCFAVYESIRRMMREKPQFDPVRFASRKEALLVITSAADTAQQYYANLFYRSTEQQLLRYAASCPGGELPREVRYFFDDFACTAPIQGFANDISLFRSAGLSAILLLQSEQQLEAMYKEEAAVIRQNCAVYAYFPGGFDNRSCEIVSKRMDLPYDEVLYAPMGKVFVMRSGCRPACLPRYDTLNSREYQEYLSCSNDRTGRRRFGGDEL